MDNRKNHKILVVEDSKIIRLANLALLKLFLMECDVAVDGIEAINKYLHNAYDLILLDIGLPSVDGLQVCRAIRKRSKDGYNPIIIAVTAHKQSVEQKCMDAGVNQVIEKPLTKIKIEELLNKWLTK